MLGSAVEALSFVAAPVHSQTARLGRTPGNCPRTHCCGTTK